MNLSIMAGPGRTPAQPKAAAPATEAAARAGLAAQGVIYLLVGLLALQVAFGRREAQADQQGALATLSDQPFGAVLLWALGIGLVGMALWRLSEAVFGGAGPDGRKPHMRLLALGRCLFYSFVAYSVLRFTVSGDGGGSGDEQSRDITATALDLPAGRWLVAVGGAVIVVAGVWIGVQAVRRTYRETLKTGEMSPAGRRLADVTGIGGGVTRGLLFAAIGTFAVQAAVKHRSDEAKGLDDTLRTFADTALGPWLLAVVALGLVLFGVFSFVLAARRRV